MHDLEIGVSQIEINPARGTQIDGDIGRRRPCENILDSIYAQALVFRQDGKLACLLALDLLAVTREFTTLIREMATRRFGIPGDAVIVHVSQNHSAPSLGHIMLDDRLPAVKTWPWLRGSDPAYHAMVMPRIETIIAQALGHMQPVSLLYGGVLDGRVAFNRRYLMRGGKVEMMGAGRPHDALAMEGPSDPDVGVVSFVGADLKPIAVLLHHTCHPVHGYPTRYVSADWPGAWRRAIQPDLGPQATPMVINGCCGNVIHGNLADPTFSSSSAKMGGILAESTRRALPNLAPQDRPVLACGRTVVQLPFRTITPTEFAAAHKLIDEHPEPMWNDASKTSTDWAWCYAASLLDVEDMFKNNRTFPYEIQAIRLGDVAIVAVMGEPFVEGQLKIKALSPAKRTLVAHMSNAYVGYIPTPAAIQGGGYESKVTMASKLAPEALAMIVQGSLDLLRSLYV